MQRRRETETGMGMPCLMVVGGIGVGQGELRKGRRGLVFFPCGIMPTLLMQPQKAVMKHRHTIYAHTKSQSGGVRSTRKNTPLREPGS
jgi:hypothetical protein